MEGIRVPRTLNEVSRFSQKLESLSQMPTVNQIENKSDIKKKKKGKSYIQVQEKNSCF